MKQKVFIRILIFCFSLECCLIGECIGIEKHKDDILPLSNNSSSQRLSGEIFGRNCSNSITLSSDGPVCQFQESLLGTYYKTSKIVRNWPTWKIDPQRLLNRCSWAEGLSYDLVTYGWSFKWRSNGNDVGWIEHKNCIGCPETCSQDWRYWNDDVKQWHYDKQILITTDQSKQTCSSSSASFNMGYLYFIIISIIVVGGVCIGLIRGKGSSRGGSGSGYGEVSFSLGGDGGGFDFGGDGD